MIPLAQNPLAQNQICYVCYSFSIGPKSDLLCVLRINWRLPLLCQKCAIWSQACWRLLYDLSGK